MSSNINSRTIKEEINRQKYDEGNHHQLVLSFLRRLSGSITMLSQNINDTNEDTQMIDATTVSSTDDNETATYYIDMISRHLLTACHPSILSLGTNNFPPLKKGLDNKAKEDEMLLEDDDDREDGDDDKSYLVLRTVRRVDYLRQFLRCLAPISMDVAAHICSIILSMKRTDATTAPSEYNLTTICKTRSSMEISAVILMSHWLDVAPQLSPLVTDLFQVLDGPSWNFNSFEMEFVITEACHNICKFYLKRQEISVVHKFWDWTFVFDLFEPKDVDMMDSSSLNVDDDKTTSFSNVLPHAIRWHAARTLACLLEWEHTVVASFLKRLKLDEEQVSWLPHPWTIDEEEATTQHLQLKGSTCLWNSEEFILPSSEIVQNVLPIPSYLARPGAGIVFYKNKALIHLFDNNDQEASPQQRFHSQSKLIATPTTRRNLSLLGASLCQEPYPPPILVCGPHGSGKSSLIRELVRLCSPNETLLEVHVDEETDSKTLIGSYTTTDIPGEFAWRPGALTRATRDGKWVLLEDVDAVPSEIQAALVKLLEDRLVPLGNGKYEQCHPNFRLFGTCTTTASSQKRESLRIGAHRGGGKRILNPNLWRNVHVQPLAFTELKDIAFALYPDIPQSVSESALNLLQVLDRSGRAQGTQFGGKAHNQKETMDDHNERSEMTVSWNVGRPPSVRDFFKLLSRISNDICFESNVSYTTEAQRTLCLAESFDVFVSACPDRTIRHDFVSQVLAPIWGISRDMALRYVDTRRPTTHIGTGFTEVGRAKIEVVRQSEFSRTPVETFAQTNHALRLMESIGVCIRENEAVLLVGETGCGKTTLVQQLAGYCERELIVQNLSLQTDSTDLLGGYKPLELQHVARKVYREFVDIFVGTFSRKQNAKFLEYACSMREKSQWKKLSQCFQRAAKLGLSKVKERKSDKSETKANRITIKSWREFEKTAQRFERQRLACDSGLAFIFSEGALVDAIRSGKWVLLDEVNLASSETLQRLCGLLDDRSGSVILTERGDAVPIERHPNFRLFAAMNPATDAGKKDLQASIRSRFSEIYVEELLDPVELRMVSARYVAGVLPAGDKPPEHTETIISAVDIYLKCRNLAEQVLVDGGGQKPRYTLRTLSRALSAARNLVIQQRFPLTRAVFEGFQLAFEGALNAPSVKTVKKVLKPLLGENFSKSEIDHPGRRPGNRKDNNQYVLVKPFWIKSGPLEPVDWSEASPTGKSRFILTTSMSSSLRRLARAVAAGPWPILLEGPTSAGKTTLVEYIAARCGHQIVRINNHEHTDVQEYTGSFAADSNGSLSFRDGILVRALKRGHWVILDELNLAPSEVLEALNRLLDDNRELYLAETNETVKPHPSFRLFATQNPCGAYGGRKPLSRAFRNRFVEIHMGDIPSNEMTTILEKRCGCPPSHAKRLVATMDMLRHRRSKTSIFLGKDSFITPRDLLRWAERHAGSKLELAQEGYMLLAERLRTQEEKQMVCEVIEENLKVSLNIDGVYYGESSEARQLLDKIVTTAGSSDEKFLSAIAPTRSLLRLLSLVVRCIRQKEPVLLVGDTGCGKTTVVQFLSMAFNQTLHAVNCHATTETSDLIGGLRPVRGRDVLARRMLHKVKHLFSCWPHEDRLRNISLPKFISFENEGEPPALENDEDEEDIVNNADLDADAVSKMIEIARSIWETRDQAESKSPEQLEKRTKKRRKLSPEKPVDTADSSNPDAIIESLTHVFHEIEELGRRHSALFEWSDGPLVDAMKSGQMLLLDEMSLADDAVLERLNSVLEPSRTLVLAEKGDDGFSDAEHENRVIVADDAFRIFATMNPGGDFGKRELSPALRSRFTEIWVPAVKERFDIELVLGRTLAGCTTRMFESDLVLERMLTYVDWFNGIVCGDPSSPFSSLELTLRDVLSWARFIVEAREINKDLDVWDAYCHGACLMHLDGLGLGAGLALEDAADAKTKSESYLLSQIPGGTYVSSFGTVREPFDVHHGGRFGVQPFYIPLGPIPIPTSTFNLSAPTTSMNMFRVLRALQLAKPVLLEGSPGVGKTSLVAALAALSGHKLVRINLSEQTDISDLMGNDLPVQQSETKGAHFKWCDGVLLTAIKEGSWVLLDELNLASQSVLEGLNSCLDHRATVFIPELGKSFKCPSSFRVFAAQNPLAQGGGRKGLPKSFLNRFTKVYVDALADSDLRAIVSSRFSSLDKGLVDNVIDFNKQVHAVVVEKHEFGEAGSPWEFNLRDVFRWCELLATRKQGVAGYARDLYFQRFRTREDREKLSALYQNFFGSAISSPHPPKVTVTDSTLQIGDTILQRYDGRKKRRCHHRNSNLDICLSLLQPMEAMARCISLKWPCLLVGSAGSGKTTAISTLAELCNMTLLEQCLAPSSDVTELIGCFEQVDMTAEHDEILQMLCNSADEFLLQRDCHAPACRRIWELSNILSRARGDEGDTNNALLSPDTSIYSLTVELLNILSSKIKEDTQFRASCGAAIDTCARSLELIAQRGKSSRKDDDASHFVWRDGILVRAMIEGHWLHLENVNLCPSSVLDRLNSVMEKDGELLLSECGVQEGDNEGSGHRSIKAHPDFRIFLSMNPVHGEVSRAMRNRCVEISLLQPIGLKLVEGDTLDDSCASKFMTQDATVDHLRIVWSGGLRSSKMASAILYSHLTEHKKSIETGEEPPCISGMLGASSLVSSSLLRGVSGQMAIRNLLQLTLEIDETKAADYLSGNSFSVLFTEDYLPLPTSPDGASSWLSNASLGRVGWQARLLRVFTEKQSTPFDVVESSRLGLLGLRTCEPKLAAKYKLLGDWNHADDDIIRLRNSLLEIFFSKASSTDLVHRLSFICSLDNSWSQTFRLMASIIRNIFSQLHSGSRYDQYSGESTSGITPNSSHVELCNLSATQRVQMHRLPQQVREKEWCATVVARGASSNLPIQASVLETSYSIHEGRIDRSSVACPVTPSLYSLFPAFDDWIGHLLTDSKVLDAIEDVTFAGMISEFLGHRDRLWCSLQTTHFSSQSSAFLGFDEAEFIVQWKWLKKSLMRLSNASMQHASDLVKKKRQMDLLVETIDVALFGNPGNISSSNSVRKKIGRTLVPQRASHWETIDKLKQLARGCTIISDDRFDSLNSIGESIELSELFDLQHPILYVPVKDMTELLGAICTAHWSSTDEMRGAARLECQPFAKFDASERLKEAFERKKRTFAAQIASTKVDSTIETVENQLDVEKLEELRLSARNFSSQTDTYSEISGKLLSSLGRIQLSALAEFWCSHEEFRIIREIQGIIVTSGNSIEMSKKTIALLPAVKELIRVVMSKTIWSIADLRPYQTLVWAIEGASVNEGSFNRLLKCILPTMSCTAFRHTWANSFVNLNVISKLMELPSFWTEEEPASYERPMSKPISSAKLNAISCGPTRLSHRVRTAATFRLVGDQFNGLSGLRMDRFYTMENNIARNQQLRELVDMYSSLKIPDTNPAPVGVQYMLVDVLEGLRDNFPEDIRIYLISLVKKPDLLVDVSTDEIRRLASTCTHRAFQDCVDELFIPLFESLRQMWKIGFQANENSQEVSLAWIYIGVLRMNLLVLDSPLDPGRAPIAKVSLINEKLIEIRLKVSALRLDSGFVHGDFTPTSDRVCGLLDEAEHLIKKRESQAKKVVERVESAPPFYDLFRETIGFVKGIAGNTTVLSLVQLICKTKTSCNELQAAREREINWQKTTSAFCSRLESFFAAYEDITTTFVDAVRCVQSGIRLLAEECIFKENDGPTHAFELLLRFPHGHIFEDTESITAALGAIEEGTNPMMTTKKSRLQQSLSLAALEKFAIQKRLLGLDSSAVASCTSILNNITGKHLGTTLSPSEKKITGLEDLHEREYREQFPDHHKEFKGLLQTNEDEEIIPEESDDVCQEFASLTEKQTELLCLLHRELFSSEAHVLDDFTRTRAFYVSYSVACQMESMYCFTRKMSLHSEHMSGHVMALPLTLKPIKDIMFNHSSSSHDGTIDFHNDPCPIEAVTAALPIQRLMARLTQLLTAFPGHSILLAVAKVCDKVSKFDLTTTPIGKVMIGLEVILGEAQDWEQHASERVQLGSSLLEIRQLVARWRNLELKSWARLIHAREERSAKKAQKHWFRLHAVLHEDHSPSMSVVESSSGSTDIESGPEDSQYTPRWIWKGLSSCSGRLSRPRDESGAEQLTELVKVIDTFILTSPVGEFEERLTLIESFSRQLQAEYFLFDKLSNWRLMQSRALSSLCSFYTQFIPFLSSKLKDQRTPIETQLADAVRLAKWDEQSYYALAASTEKNHRKLMKILAEYDEVLCLNVGILIQEDSCSGIRSNVDAHDEMCASMPPQQVMFPTAQRDKSEAKEGPVTANVKTGSSRKWADATVVGASSKAHVCKMQKYALKMEDILNKVASRPDTWALSGTGEASDLCDSIFERLESLRSKGTRPMKERALTDLFRELKRNGFSSMKWSVPKESRQMVHLLQLPNPGSNADLLGPLDLPILQKAEIYFERCLAELNSFRSESVMLGSKHMTQREINKMLNLSEHGMLMLIQQRGILSNLILDIAKLRQYSRLIAEDNKSLPTCQTSLKVSVKTFQTDYISAIECLQQLSLLIRSSQKLLTEGKKADWARDTISRIDASASLLSDNILPVDNLTIVTWKQLKSIEAATDRMKDAEGVICECWKDCVSIGCIPGDSFECCSKAIQRAISAASQCSESFGKIEGIENDVKTSDYLNSLSTAIENSLMTVQNFCGSSSIVGSTTEDNDDNIDEDNFHGDGKSIWESHIDAANDWAAINLKRLSNALREVFDKLRSLHDTNASNGKQRDCCVCLVSDLSVLLGYVVHMSEHRLLEYLKLYRTTGKLNYILVRLFRVLVSKGYCSDVSSGDDDGDAEGDVSGMTFEDDKDGTGMGEGDGKRDVTDQLESEEQLLGLKGEDENDEAGETQESRQLNEEEAGQGMEMENDFDGEMCDLPDKQEVDDNEEEPDDEEELEREMGDDVDPNEDVVDEKMWNDSDDENDIDTSEEKFEKDSNMKGEAIEGETRTKEDDEKERGDESQEKEEGDDDNRPKDDGGDMDNATEEQELNEDTEDKYEDHHGVDVRDDEAKDVNNDEDEEEQMQLDDDMHLDGEDGQDGDDDNAEDGDENEMEVDAEDTANIEENKEGDDEGDEGDDEVDPMENNTQPAAAGSAEIETEPPQDEQGEEDEKDESPIDVPNQEQSTQQSYGLKSRDGKDSMLEDVKDGDEEEPDGECEAEEETDAADGGGTGSSQVDPSGGAGGGEGYNEQNGGMDESPETTQQDSSEIPNPFKTPGDATKFWHRKLNIVDTNPNVQEEEDAMETGEGADEEEENHGDGDFEFTSSDQKSSSQVLGEAKEEEAIQLERQQKEENKVDDEENRVDDVNKKEKKRKDLNKPRDQSTARQSAKKPDPMQEEDEEENNNSDVESDESVSKEQDDDGDESGHSNDEEDPNDEDLESGNKVVSDLSRLNVHGDDMEGQKNDNNRIDIIQDEQVSGISSAEAAEARQRWLQIQGETFNLSRRLCEKLRLVMEPLVASKLRGDYRTGKRINMKRVIGYIASGYRKDKIWLRRTKPAKRNYRVLLAVDDSESMLKSGAGDMALRAMATLAVGMNQLEIGELGVASFGEDMKLLHPFHLPFTSDSGVSVVQNFQFNQQRTRTALCVESAMTALEQEGGGGGDGSSMQLVFLISDGRIERDSRTVLKRLIRDMVERNVLLAMIIVEGGGTTNTNDKKNNNNNKKSRKKKDSIVNMKEVTFEKGKPVVRRFIEDYPFPYYIVLDDMTSLPEVLGDALRQWFEMLTQLQGNS